MLLRLKLFLVPLLGLSCGPAPSPLFVEASGLEYNPVTYIQAQLSDQHPAYGGPLKGNFVHPVIFADPNEARAEAMEVVNTSAIVTQSQRQMRHLEATSADLSKLASYFGQPMERNYNTLMTATYKSGKAPRIPWPGSYWPTYQDSINFRYNNDISPAERYARAFGKNVQKFMDNVSKQRGIDAYPSYPACSSSGDCGGSPCAIRDGRTQGRCLPTWWGICHAWAPAAVLEPEPKCSVVKNGVTFRPFDIKGLLSAVYDGAGLTVIFTGARFNGPDSPEVKDKYGRYTDAARRDLGPGFFHLAVANIMGKFKQSFVVDVSSGAQVWNQPVRDYTIVSSKVMNVRTASLQYFGTNTYPFNSNAKYLAPTTMRFRYINEGYTDGPLIPDFADSYTGSKDYQYILELDASYNVIGGEWLGDSRSDHPDFLWFAAATPDLATVTSLDLSYKEVRGLLDLSVACTATA